MLRTIQNVSLRRSSHQFSTLNIPQLLELGIKNRNIKYNFSYDKLFQEEVKNKEGQVFKTDYGETFGVDTGKFTGRSPNDKWIVQNVNSESNKNIWWENVNKPIEPHVFDDLLESSITHFNNLEIILSL